LFGDEVFLDEFYRCIEI